MKLRPGLVTIFALLLFPSMIPPAAQGEKLPSPPLRRDFNSYLPPDLLSFRTPDPPWLTHELRERRDADLSRFIRGYLGNQLPPGQDARRKIVTIYYKRWNISMANILRVQVPSYPVEDLRMRDFPPFRNAPRFSIGMATGRPQPADNPLSFAPLTSQDAPPNLLDRLDSAESYIVPVLCGVIGVAALAFVIFALNTMMMNRRMKGP
ncbi:MAG: hypothetical protein V1809_02650 [Planctomycetota bacterium]